MSSLATDRSAVHAGLPADEATLYLATGAALGSSLLAAGWASGSPRVGLLGAALAEAGIWLSWRLRGWSVGARIALGLPAAALAAGGLHGLISWEIAHEVGMLYAAQGDVGLILALRMSLLLVALCFLVVRWEMLPFRLVPAVTLFGLAGGRGVTAVAFGCFLVFLPASLAALAQAMLLSGRQPRTRETETQQPYPALSAITILGSRISVASWRSRHWSLLGLLIAAIIALATLIYLPVYSYGTQYYWPLAMMSLPGARLGFLDQRRTVDTYRTYAVGQGPVAPGETIMLSYTGPAVPLWRGEVYDSFTGNAWRSTDDDPSLLPIVEGQVILRPGKVDGDSQSADATAAGPPPQPPISHLQPPTSPPQSLVTHEVRIEHPMPFVIYSPGQLHRLTLPPRLAASANGRLHLDRFGCVTAPGADLPQGARYWVSSAPDSYPEMRDPTPDPRLSALDQSYLRIPVSSRRVADLARRITANAESTQEKLQALRSYLERRCIYTLTAPAVPAGADAADFFLFTSRRGYCDLFATAFAVMARSVGIPARFVTGYAGGSPASATAESNGEPFRRPGRPGGRQDPDLNRTYLRELDAHAWVEVWPPEAGHWLAVDPTPAGGPIALSPFAQWVGTVQILFRSQRWAWPLAALLLAAPAAAALASLRRRRAGQLQLALDRNDPRAVVIRAYARFTRALARRGLPRRPHQTPLEYLGKALEIGKWRVDGEAVTNPSPISNLQSLTHLFLLARYSPHPITPQTASVALGQLEQGLAALGGRGPRPR